MNFSLETTHDFPAISLHPERLGEDALASLGGPDLNAVLLQGSVRKP